METLDNSFSCDKCAFSIQKLKQMAEKGGTTEKFSTLGKRTKMTIIEVDTAGGFIVMRRGRSGDLLPKNSTSRE